ncbi:repetitive organellar protein [Calliphora vicina]|uniref:repetitive organellar protein n=1 Tax=Calliphora vicina TaxID=7373 RepID=UPI00325B70DA
MNNFNFDLDNTVDEDFFGSLKGSKSSKLQQLFGGDALSSDDKQQSLKYKRPKANDLTNKEVNDVASKSNATSITLMAKVVTAYRQGEMQGKVGLALIQNPDNSYNIIMYKTKVYILATLKLQTGQDLLYKQTKYWQFYDEESIYWSFSFDTVTDEEEFVDKLNDKNITYKESQEKANVTDNILELPKLNTETEDIVIEEDFTKQIPAVATKESKNSLIKRMAKMGRPLPTLSSSNQQTTTDFSDSSDTEVIKTPLASLQKPSITPRSNKVANIKTNHQLVTSMAAYNTAATTSTAVYPVNPMESQYMQMLLTEQRTQGSELRMNMNKLENKIEKVLDKLELYDRPEGKQRPEKDDEILELEEKLLMLKKENRKLKQTIQERSCKESEENKIQDIVYEFKEDLKHFNIDYKQDLKYILKDLQDKLRENQKITQETQKQLEANEIKLREEQKELVLKTSHNIEIQNEISLLKEQQNDFKFKLNEKDTEVVKLKQELLDLQSKLQEKCVESIKTPDDAVIKSIMNNLYVDIADKLDNSNLPQTEQVLALIAASIRQQTLKSLQKSKP